MHGRLVCTKYHLSYRGMHIPRMLDAQVYVQQTHRESSLGVLIFERLEISFVFALPPSSLSPRHVYSLQGTGEANMTTR